MKYSGNTMEQENQAILRSAIRGNRQMYGLLVKRYMKQAYKIAYGFVHRSEDAVDLSQEAFIKAYQNRKKFDLARPFLPWFYAILKNICLDFLKKQERNRGIIRGLKNTRRSFSSDSALDRESVWELLNRLEPRHREVLILKGIHGYSYREIAEITGIPLGTVMSSLYYARKNFQKLMGETS